MQITETLADGLKHDFRIVVPAEDLRTEIDRKLEEYGADMRLPGFRPGRAPLKILRQRFGRAVEGEIIEETVKRSVQQAMEDRGLTPAIMPQVDLVSALDHGLPAGVDLEYTVSVEALPDIELGDFGSLELERLEAEPTDEAIEKEIGLIATRAASLVPVEGDRGAAEGDTLTVDFVGRIDGKTFAGSTAEDYEARLGAKDFTIGFEERLVGARAGESRDIDVAFPDDHDVAHLAGKTVVFSIEVKKVRERRGREPDDGLAKQVGFDDLAALRLGVADQVRRRYASVSRTIVKRRLFDRLEQTHDFPLPESMVGREFEAIWGPVKESLARPDDDEARKGKTEEELRNDYRRVAERRVRVALLLGQVGRQNNIEVRQGELEEVVVRQVQRFPERAEALLDFYRKNPSALSQFEGPILEDKAVDYILELARVTTRQVSAEELIAESEDVSLEE